MGLQQPEVDADESISRPNAEQHKLDAEIAFTAVREQVLRLASIEESTLDQVLPHVSVADEELREAVWSLVVGNQHLLTKKRKIALLEFSLDGVSGREERADKESTSQKVSSKRLQVLLYCSCSMCPLSLHNTVLS